jgi:hypothetical protein
MSDLSAILLMVTAFGGLAVIGVVILLSGLVAAERTSSVIWCAAAAALLFTVQLSWIGLWHSFGVGFGGEDIKGRTVLQWGSVGAVLLVGSFLALKFPSVVERAVENGKWWRDGARVSALIVAAYVLYLVGGIFLRWAYPRGGIVSPPSLTSWITVLGGVVLAWGLWRHRVWAWYGTLICCVYAIARILWFTWPNLPSDLSFLFMTTPVGVRLILLVLLLGVLLLSNARKLCGNKDAVTR